VSLRKFIFMKRKPTVSWSDFSAHWRGPHAALIAGTPVFWEGYTLTYIQNHVRPEAIGRFPVPSWDGVVETVLREDATSDFREDMAYQTRVRPDEDNFLAPEQSVSMFVRSDVILDGPRRGVKLLLLLRRHHGLSFEQFQAYWRDQHGKMALRDPHFSQYLRRYVQHLVLPDTIRSATGHRGYDGIGEFWFDTTDELVAAYAQQSFNGEHLPDLRRFVHNPPSPVLVIDEVEVMRP
jgi:EthD domain